MVQRGRRGGGGRIGRIGNGRTGAMGSLREANIPSCLGKRARKASVLPPFLSTLSGSRLG